jgi:hypothetical protein
MRPEQRNQGQQPARCPAGTSPRQAAGPDQGRRPVYPRARCTLTWRVGGLREMYDAARTVGDRSRRRTGHGRARHSLESKGGHTFERVSLLQDLPVPQETGPWTSTSNALTGRNGDRSRVGGCEFIKPHSDVREVPKTCFGGSNGKLKKRTWVVGACQSRVQE